MVELSVIIVTWNCRKYLQDFFDSFGALLTDTSVQIIVIDNASTDGSADLIEKDFPTVQLIREKTNLGFARANNVGLSMATGELVCLINPDVRILSDCMERMMKEMRSHGEIGLLGPRMLDAQERVRRSTMRYPTVWNYFCQALGLHVLFPGSMFFGGFLMWDFEHDETREVEVLNGWYWMTRRSALEQVGNLDDRFFIYGEDIDWCKRFHDAGWKLVYFADASAIHYGGGSSSNAPVRFYVEQQRANLQYFTKHHNVARQLGFIVSMWLYHLVRILGHGANYVLKYSKREEVRPKVKRSMACILWLLGSTSSAGRKN